MSTYALNDSEAIANLVKNPGSRWYKPGIDVKSKSREFAIQRINQRLFTPIFNETGFQMSRKDSLFAMGSCFARGIENAMLGKKFNVLSAATEFDSFELAVPGVTGRGFMNKYSTHSIRHELEWALDPSVTFPEASLVDAQDGTWIDPSTNPTLKWVSHEETLGRRAIISNVVQRAKQCRVIVLTLGLVELWFDNLAGIYLNMAPSPTMRKLHPGRYSFEVSGFVENRANMEAIGALLKKVGGPDLQIVVTTSPVPLMATFTDRDIVAANTYSKSVLRAVAEDFAASHDFVHYFPSYEIVMNSDRKIAWAEDGRHVVGKVVHHIMDIFCANYVAD